LQAAQIFRRLWSVYEENRDLILMGAYRTGSDPIVDVAIARHDQILEFISQGQTEHVDYASAVEAVIAGFGG
jgi:flagellum-specific ATP synthase